MLHFYCGEHKYNQIIYLICTVGKIDNKQILHITVWYLFHIQISYRCMLFDKSIYLNATHYSANTHDLIYT